MFKSPGHRVFLVRALVGLESYVQQLGTVTNWHRLFARVRRARGRARAPASLHVQARSDRARGPRSRRPMAEFVGSMSLRPAGEWPILPHAACFAATRVTSPWSPFPTCRSSTSPVRSRCSRCASRVLARARQRAARRLRVEIVATRRRRARDVVGAAARRRPRARARCAAASTRCSSRAASATAAAIADRRCSRWLRAHGAARPAARLGLHRQLPARRGRPARRPARDHALGVRATRSRERYPARHRRARSDLRPRRQRLHLGRRHRRHGPGARARRGGPRPRARARRSRASSCCSSGGRAASRSSARSSRCRPPTASRSASCRRGSPSTSATTCSVPALAAPRGDEPAQLRARLHARGRHDAGALRRVGARRGGAPPARGVGRTASTASPRDCGFGTAESMRRAFLRTLRVPPERLPQSLPRRAPLAPRHGKEQRMEPSTIGILLFDGRRGARLRRAVGGVHVPPRCSTAATAWSPIAEHERPVRCAKGLRVLPDHTFATRRRSTWCSSPAGRARAARSTIPRDLTGSATRRARAAPG